MVSNVDSVSLKVNTVDYSNFTINVYGNSGCTTGEEIATLSDLNGNNNSITITGHITVEKTYTFYVKVESNDGSTCSNTSVDYTYDLTSPASIVSKSVARYDFENSLLDLTSNGNDLFSSDPTFGTYGNSQFSSGESFLSIDGTRAIVAEADESLRPNQNISVSFWAFVKNYNDQTFISNMVTSQASSGGYDFSIEGSKLRFQAYNENEFATVETPATDVPLNTWTHIVAVLEAGISGNNSRKGAIYINGIKKLSTSPDTFNYSTFTYASTTHPVCVGGKLSSGECVGDVTDLDLDLLQIFNGALNQNEVTYLFHNYSSDEIIGSNTDSAMAALDDAFVDLDTTCPVGESYSSSSGYCLPSTCTLSITNGIDQTVNYGTDITDYCAQGYEGSEGTITCGADGIFQNSSGNSVNATCNLIYTATSLTLTRENWMGFENCDDGTEDGIDVLFNEEAFAMVFELDSSLEVTLPVAMDSYQGIYIDDGNGDCNHVTNTNKEKLTLSYPNKTAGEEVIVRLAKAPSDSSNPNDDWPDEGLKTWNATRSTSFQNTLKEVLSFGNLNFVNLGQAFRNCTKLEKFTAGGSESGALTTTMFYFFRNANALREVDLTGMNFTNVTSSNGFFEDAESLISVDLTPMNSGSSSSANMTFNHFFDNCRNLTNITGLDTLDVSGSTQFDSMFYNTTKLDQTVDLGSWNMANALYLRYMFRKSKIHPINIENWNVENVRSFRMMFASNQSITSYNLDNWTFGVDNNGNCLNDVEISYMFYGHEASITSLSVDFGNTKCITKLANAFMYLNYNGDRLTTLNLSNWDTTNVTDQAYLFYNAEITNLNLGYWEDDNVESGRGAMFLDNTNAALTCLNQDSPNDVSNGTYSIQPQGDDATWTCSNP